MAPTNLPDLATAELRKRIEKADTQKAVANDLGISESLLTDILKGRRTVSPTLLEKLGLVNISINVPAGIAARVTSAISLAMQEKGNGKR